jgi:hypothetical protein
MPCYAMPCHAMLCHAMLYYAMPCYAMPCYAMLCHAMLCHAMLCYAMPCHAMLCHAMLCYAMLCYAMLCYAMACHAMLCYAMLCHAMPCHAMPCYLVQYAVVWQFAHIALISAHYTLPSSAVGITSPKSLRRNRCLKYFGTTSNFTMLIISYRALPDRIRLMDSKRGRDVRWDGGESHATSNWENRSYTMFGILKKKITTLLACWCWQSQPEWT